MAKPFYKLDYEDYAQSCRQLTKAQLAILYYLRARSPWAGKQINVTRQELCTELGLHKSTVSRAIAKLTELDLISSQATAWDIAVNPHGPDLHQGDQVDAPTQPVTPMQQIDQTHSRNQVDAFTQPISHSRNDRGLEPLSDAVPESLRSIRSIRSSGVIKNQFAQTKEMLDRQRDQEAQNRKFWQEFETWSQDDQDEYWYNHCSRMPHSIRIQSQYYPAYLKYKSKLEQLNNKEGDREE